VQVMMIYAQLQRHQLASHLTRNPLLEHAARPLPVIFRKMHRRLHLSSQRWQQMMEEEPAKE
jgi:hypothetical protein